MKHNYTEKILSPNFRQDIFQQIQLLVKAGSSFTIIGMPFVGISPFLRFVATTKLAYFSYVDVHALFHRNKNELFLSIYKELGGDKSHLTSQDAFDECKTQLKVLLQTEKRIVIMINRFDYLNKNEFTNGIFTNLKSLEDIGKGRIVFIVTSSKQIYEIDEMALCDSNLAFISKIIYFPPYFGKDIKKILMLSPIALKPDPNDLKKAINLSAGHATLLQLLLKTEYLENPLEDTFIKLHLKIIYEICTSKQKISLNKLAVGKHINYVDSFLLKVGMINQVGKHYEIFSPLLIQYINSYAKIKLSKKEKILFYLLKKNLGRIVKKDFIFREVWGKDQDKATDWALNSLIYRLRKNPTVLNNRYAIENDKDIGYRMTKEI